MPALEIACPSCGKTNAAAPCQRCGCDLAPLFAIRRAAETALGSAAQHLRKGAAREALADAGRSWDLRNSVEAVHLACLASIVLGDMHELGEWRNRGYEQGTAIPGR
jgi:hypothetical protein